MADNNGADRAGKSQATLGFIVMLTIVPPAILGGMHLQRLYRQAHHETSGGGGGYSIAEAAAGGGDSRPRVSPHRSASADDDFDDTASQRARFRRSLLADRVALTPRATSGSARAVAMPDLPAADIADAYSPGAAAANAPVIAATPAVVENVTRPDALDGARSTGATAAAVSTAFTPGGAGAFYLPAEGGRNTSPETPPALPGLSARPVLVAWNSRSAPDGAASRRTVNGEAGTGAHTALTRAQPGASSETLSFTASAFDPPPPATATGIGYSEASGVSANGSIAGYTVGVDNTSGAYVYSGYVLNGATGAQTFVNVGGANAPTGLVNVTLTAINDNGFLSGTGYTSAFTSTGSFLYNANTSAFLTPNLTGLGSGVVSFQFNNVNENNLVAVVYAKSDGIDHGAIYNINTNSVTLISDITGYSGLFVQTVTSDGAILATVKTGSGVTEGVLIRTGSGGTTYTYIAVPASVSATVSATNADAITTTGLVSGNYVDAAGTHGFVYDMNSGIWYPLDYNDGSGNASLATQFYYGNNDSLIAGSYEDSSGYLHSLLAGIEITSSAASPEPGSACLLILPGMLWGGACLRKRRRRRRPVETSA